MVQNTKQTTTSAAQAAPISKKLCDWCGRESSYPCSDATDEQLRVTYHARRKGESDDTCLKEIPKRVTI